MRNEKNFLIPEVGKLYRLRANNWCQDAIEEFISLKPNDVILFLKEEKVLHLGDDDYGIKITFLFKKRVCYMSWSSIGTLLKFPEENYFGWNFLELK